jgi:hypothetical protein
MGCKLVACSMYPVACSLTCGKEEDSFEARDLGHVQVQHLQLLHLLLEYPATEEHIIDLVLTGQICLHCKKMLAVFPSPGKALNFFTVYITFPNHSTMEKE